MGYAYDEDQYDKEREQRAKAGIVDFTEFGPEQGPGQAAGPAGGGLDALGYERGQGDEGGYIDDDMLDVNEKMYPLIFLILMH